MDFSARLFLLAALCGTFFITSMCSLFDPFRELTVPGEPQSEGTENDTPKPQATIYIFSSIGWLYAGGAYGVELDRDVMVYLQKGRWIGFTIDAGHHEFEIRSDKYRTFRLPSDEFIALDFETGKTYCLEVKKPFFSGDKLTLVDFSKCQKEVPKRKLAELFYIAEAFKGSVITTFPE